MYAAVNEPPRRVAGPHLDKMIMRILPIAVLIITLNRYNNAKYFLN